jgi:hypothetical protein
MAVFGKSDYWIVLAWWRRAKQVGEVIGGERIMFPQSLEEQNGCNSQFEGGSKWTSD